MKRHSWLFIVFFIAQSALALPTQSLTPIGTATLKKMFWTIYDSTLYSEDGLYQGIEPNLALAITYRRAIASRQLIDSTRSEWRKMSLYKREQSEAWLGLLSDIWPDVEKGDVITLHVGDGLASTFYFNGQAVGTIDSADFTQDFLAIWLSPDTSYPALREKLMGK